MQELQLCLCVCQSYAKNTIGSFFPDTAYEVIIPDYKILSAVVEEGDRHVSIYRFIGGLYGRAIGHMFVYAHGEIPVKEAWLWMDPGAFALMGAASFFSGVTRLTFSLTIIIVRRRCSLCIG